MNKYFTIIFVLIIFAAQAQAQVPVPAPNQTQSILLVGATLHRGDGTPALQNSAIAFDNGKITFVGTAEQVSRSQYQQVVDVAGKHVYPSFIAPSTTLGLNEVDAVRAARDDAEVGKYNPSVRSLIAYNAESEVMPTCKNTGVLVAQIVPQGGTISGSSSVVQLDAWNYEDAVLLAEDGIHLNWCNTESKTYSEDVAKLYDYFSQAQRYQTVTMGDKQNLHFEAMRAIFLGNGKIYIHENSAKGILEITSSQSLCASDVSSSFGLLNFSK